MKYLPSLIGKVLCLAAVLSGVGAGAAVPWYPSGPDGGDARAFAPDPKNAAHVYLGTANGWIYDSEDGGRHWRRLARVGMRDDLVLDNIVVDASDSTHIVVGAWVLDHPDGGLYTSADSGKTWTSQPEMKGQSIRSLTDAPSDAHTLIAGTLTGVYRSKDGGSHWSLISPAASKEIHEVESLAVDPENPQIIYAGTWHLPWKTVDGGAHWNSIKQGIIEDSDVFSIIVDPKQSTVVYASACSGIYKSEDGGLRFAKVQGIPSEARRTRVLMQDPVHLETVFAGTTEGLFRTPDGGRSWVRTTGPEVIVNDVYVDPSNADHVLLATDRGGVLTSDDGGFTFRPSNAGFSERQVTAYANDVTNPARIYVGVVNDKEAGGVFVSEDAGGNWVQQSTGLGGKDVFSLVQAHDGTIVAGTSHGIFVLRDGVWSGVINELIAKSAAGGAKPKPGVVAKIPAKKSASVKKAVAPKKNSLARSKKSVASHGRKLPAKLAPLKKKVAPKKILTARQKKLQQRGRSTTASRAAAERAATEKAATLAAAKSAAALPFSGLVYGLATTGDVLIAATSGGVLRSTSDGATWRKVSSLGKGEWRYVAVIGGDVIVAGLRDIALSKDAGETWEAINGPEELKQIGAVAMAPGGELWVGGLEGAFYSKDAGETWKPVENTYVVDINSIYYDAAGQRMLLTAETTTTVAVSVRLSDRIVSRTDTGWNLRFLRPLGDHLLGATLFDGIVQQPRMVVSH